MKYNHDEISAIIAELGEQNIVIDTADGYAAAPLTINDLITFIHTTGACVSRHTKPAPKDG